jgi:alpha-beta hydrolase superfamily lysophospholipase
MTYVNSGGRRLFYSASGDGPPVLWHAGGCGDGTMWRTAGYLSALPGYRHLLFDHRGHGQSAAPAAAMPDAEAVALPGLGHLQAFWKTRMSVPPIERFLRGLRGGAHGWR